LQRWPIETFYQDSKTSLDVHFVSPVPVDCTDNNV